MTPFSNESNFKTCILPPEGQTWTHSSTLWHLVPWVQQVTAEHCIPCESPRGKGLWQTERMAAVSAGQWDAGADTGSTSLEEPDSAGLHENTARWCVMLTYAQLPSSETLTPFSKYLQAATHILHVLSSLPCTAIPTPPVVNITRTDVGCSQTSPLAMEMLVELESVPQQEMYAQDTASASLLPFIQLILFLFCILKDLN